MQMIKKIYRLKNNFQVAFFLVMITSINYCQAQEVKPANISQFPLEEEIIPINHDWEFLLRFKNACRDQDLVVCSELFMYKPDGFSIIKNGVKYDNLNAVDSLISCFSDRISVQRTGKVIC